MKKGYHLTSLLIAMALCPLQGFAFLFRPPMFTVLTPSTARSSSLLLKKQSRIVPSSIMTLYGTPEDSTSTSENADSNQQGIALSIDDRLYRLRLSRATGIEWGTDLSFSFVYVRAMDPSGEAALTRQIDVGDQLCELRPVVENESDEQVAPVNLVGAPFDFVMTTFAELDKTVREVELVFFKGTKEELKAVASGGDPNAKDPETVTITVIQNKGSKDEQTKTITVPAGSNIREVLVENDINVYQSFTRWTNCKGKQLCGTCIVNVTDGAINTNRKSMDEESTLRENPESYRLACIAFAYGDVTVETFPPIEATQWTR